MSLAINLWGDYVHTRQSNSTSSHATSQAVYDSRW
jgi:hypothetical protein